MAMLEVTVSSTLYLKWPINIACGIRAGGNENSLFAEDGHSNVTHLTKPAPPSTNMTSTG